MQANDFFKYLQNPHLISEQHVTELKKIVDEFPYFQSANILLSLASKKWDTALYQQTLKRTAITITNRTKLFELIQHLESVNSNVFENVQITNYQSTTASEKEVATSIQKEVNVTENETLIEIKNKLTEISNELTILKSTELSTQSNDNEEVAKVIVIDEAKTKTNDNTGSVEKINEETVEKELNKSLINAYIEKEVLDTPSLHHPEEEKTPQTFSDWLLLLKKNNGQSIEEIEQQAILQREKNQPKLKPNYTQIDKNEGEIAKKKQKMDLIDKIIEKNPGSIRQKDDKKLFVANTQAKESLLENEHLVTETLAKIYALQGNIAKAIRAYEILSLKFPQKSVYFASLIKNLRENQ